MLDIEDETQPNGRVFEKVSLLLVNRLDLLPSLSLQCLVSECQFITYRQACARIDAVGRDLLMSRMKHAVNEFQVEIIIIPRTHYETRCVRAGRRHSNAIFLSFLANLAPNRMSLPCDLTSYCYQVYLSGSSTRQVVY